MIAFVGSSMANTVEVKSLESIELIRDCMSEARAAQDAAFAATGNYNVAVGAGLDALAACIEDTLGSTKPKKSVN